jgi:LDH2 family malate/lactate/ureidoglycolate dehydrogenase
MIYISQVPIRTLRSNILAALRVQGHTDAHDCEIIADTLVFAETRSNNQGIIKLIAGALKPAPDSASKSISTVIETPVSAKLDGASKIGMVVVSKSVDIAIGTYRRSSKR